MESILDLTKHPEPVSYVQPKVFRIGRPMIDYLQMEAYCKYTGQTAFLDDLAAARGSGVDESLCMSSFFAKLCYRSLVTGKNDNISKIRSIPDNIQATFDAAHGSVFEHAWFNFVITDCSRILTHEAVRHRAGTAMSQTSGRYCRSDRLFFVTDPILEPVADSLDAALTVLQMGYLDLVDGMGFNGREGVERFVRGGNGSAKLNKMVNGMEGDAYEAKITEEIDRRMILLGDKPKSFDWKKKVTSALRRMLPNGQANELGFSLNIRALRHFILLRTAAGAEREIRDVAGQIYQLVKPIMPLAFAEAKEEMVDGLLEVRGLRMQPYERRCDEE